MFKDVFNCGPFEERVPIMRRGWKSLLEKRFGKVSSNALSVDTSREILDL